MSFSSVKISALPTVTGLNVGDLIPIVRSGVTSHTTMPFGSDSSGNVVVNALFGPPVGSVFLVSSQVDQNLQITANGTGVLTVTSPHFNLSNLGDITSIRNLTTTNLITAGVGLSVTTGNLQVLDGSLGVNTNISTTTGNFVNVLAGTGRILVPVTATAAAGATATANGKFIQVTFTAVSLLADNFLALTIANSFIGGASTVISYSWSGATTGSALSMQSVVASTGQVVFTITNGTGATTSTANIVITAELVTP